MTFFLAVLVVMFGLLLIDVWLCEVVKRRNRRASQMLFDAQGRKRLGR